MIYPQTKKVGQKMNKTYGFLTDKRFCERRIAEAEKTIREQHKNIEYYEGLLKRFDKNPDYKFYGYSSCQYNREDIEKWIDDAKDIIARAIGKKILYRDQIEG